MSEATIHSLGAYAPAFYIESSTFENAWGRHAGAGIERIAVADADEDALTMAWEAAKRTMAAAEVDTEDISYLGFATTTPPIDEEDLTARLHSMLGLGDEVRHSYIVGSSRVGTHALIEGLDACGDDERVGLVVVSDLPRGDPDSAIGQSAGAGAAAFIIGPDGPGEISDVAHGSHVAPGHRYRPTEQAESTGLDITAYDRQSYREAIVAAVAALDVDHIDVDAAAIQSYDGKEPYRLADALDLSNETIYHGSTVQDIGNTGGASVPLGIVHAVSGGASSVLAVGYGTGATADALVLDLEGVPTAATLEPTNGLEYSDYLRRRGHLDGTAPEGGGAYVSMPSWVRSLPQRHRLIAGRCVACGTLAFPPEGMCPACNDADRYESVALDGTGSVEAVTTISAGGAPPEFETYQTRVGAFQTAIVSFDGPDGDAVSAPVMVTSDTAVSVGDRVEARIRRIYTQEGLPRYGIKVTAVD